MKKSELVLVTGGAGFVGSHLVDALINKGYKVRIMDNLTRPTHNGKLPDWHNKKAEFFKGDVRKKSDWKKALKDVSYVFHLAAYMDFHLDFSRYVDTNSTSVGLLYEIAVENKLPLKKVIFASSQSVYGEGKYKCTKHGIFYADLRTEEQCLKHQWNVICPKCKSVAQILPELETDELRPEIPYGISKAASEKLCLTLGKRFNIPSVIIRPSIIQGSRQSLRSFSGVLKDFTLKALNGYPIKMYEDGQGIRDFVNVHDAVDAYLAVMKSNKADFEIFNLGIGKTITIWKLAELVCQVTNSSSEITATKEFRIYSPRSSKMSISKLKKLGWQPKHNIEDSIHEYVNWIQGYPEALNTWKKTHDKMLKSGVLKK